MCGIAGIFNTSSNHIVEPDVLQKMIASIHHRGPDESGIYLDDHIGLAHARLSIIDLENGIQPISNEDETLWIIYNGEVFNYDELKKGLKKSGHQFKTQTDTEVILHLYEEKGAGCLDLLNGQFAFAIWDPGKHELFLARDRAGIRPLFYSSQNGRFIFASEMKAIMQVPYFRRQINHEAINQVFTFWTTMNSTTPFTGIQSLGPGQYMKISKRGQTIQTWWQLPFVSRSEQNNASLNDTIEQANTLLSDAVKIRLKADVPVGGYLSGGLDSSTTTFKIIESGQDNLQTYGIRFKNENFDEGRYQSLMNTMLGTRHHNITISDKEIADYFQQAVYYSEMPLLRTSPIPLMLLSNQVKKNKMKVVLTGEGADEIFGGYNLFRETKARLFWSRQPDSTWRNLLIKKLYPYIFGDNASNLMMNFFAQNLKNTADPLYSHRIRWHNTSKSKQFFSESLKADHTLSLDDLFIGTLPDNFHTWDYLSKAQYLEMTIFMSNYLLSSQGDRMAMANSVEIRIPFLDHRLMEFACQLPAKWKIRGMDEKYLLKRTMANHLPAQISKRAKQPYRAPISNTLLKQNWAKELLSEAHLKEVNLFDPAKVALLIKKIKNRAEISEIDGMTITGILTTQSLHHQFIQNKPAISNKFQQPNLVIDRRSAMEIAA